MFRCSDKLFKGNLMGEAGMSLGEENCKRLEEWINVPDCLGAGGDFCGELGGHIDVSVHVCMREI